MMPTFTLFRLPEPRQKAKAPKPPIRNPPFTLPLPSLPTPPPSAFVELRRDESAGVELRRDESDGRGSRERRGGTAVVESSPLVFEEPFVKVGIAVGLGPAIVADAGVDGEF